MLVLTRKSNQSIMIGDDIEVSVLSIMGEKVRIGIQAPRDIPVFRKEVYLEIQQERGRELAGSGARTEVDAALHRLGGSKERPRRPRRADRRSPPADGPSAHHDVERPEHRDGDEHRRGQQDEDEHDEAGRSGLVRALDPALAGPLRGLAVEPLAAHAVGLGLLEEGSLELRQALSHAHRHGRWRLLRGGARAP